MIELGNKAKSVVNGFTGIVTGRTEYLNGCVQYLLKPPVGKDGKNLEGDWFDEQELKVLKGGVDLSSTPTGGVQSDAPRGIGRARL